MSKKILFMFLFFTVPVMHVYANVPTTAPYKVQPAAQTYQPKGTPNPLVIVKSKKTLGFGEMAEGALKPLSALAHFIQAICTIAGVGLFFGSFLQFTAHRRNPSEVRLGQPVAMLLAGLALLLLGFLSYL